MARRSKIEQLGLEAEVLARSQKGETARGIAKALSRQHKQNVSYSAVNRFLQQETRDRQQVRRAVTAQKAAELAGNAAQDADQNLDAMRSVVAPLALMATHHVRRVRFPDEAVNIRPAQDANEEDALEQQSRIDQGQREWFEPIAAKDAIRAAAVLKDTTAYLVELAGANPRPTDPKNLDAIRAQIAEVFGYTTQPDTSTPQEAPLTPDEHTPPVVTH